MYWINLTLIRMTQQQRVQLDPSAYACHRLCGMGRVSSTVVSYALLLVALLADGV